MGKVNSYFLFVQYSFSNIYMAFDICITTNVKPSAPA